MSSKLRWLLPLLVLGLAELAARRAFGAVPHGWYDEVAAGERWDGDVVCIGSSLTAYAIEARRFEEFAGAAGEDVRVHNFGMGAVPIALHEVALRALTRREPGLLAGAHFLIEAPGGLPYYTRTAELDETADYLTPSNRAQQLFVVTAGRQELAELWTTSASLENKLGYTLRWCTSGIALSSERDRCREALLDRWRVFVRSALGRFLPARAPRQRSEPLSNVAGLRADEDLGLRAQEMLDHLRAQRRPQSDYPAWERSTFATLVEFVRSQGAEVAVYDPPLHPSYREVLERDETVPVRADFARYLEGQGIPFLRAQFRAEDRLFPDFFHLAPARAPAFTRALVQEWLRL
jgi:hypothetical protein